MLGKPWGNASVLAPPPDPVSPQCHHSPHLCPQHRTRPQCPDNRLRAKVVVSFEIIDLGEASEKQNRRVKDEGGDAWQQTLYAPALPCPTCTA